MPQEILTSTSHLFDGTTDPVVVGLGRILVGVGALWAWDITGDDELWRPYRVPVLLAVLAGGLATYGFEVAEFRPDGRGIGLGVAAGLAISIWSRELAWHTHTVILAAPSLLAGALVLRFYVQGGRSSRRARRA